ncbi:MAG TPA: protein kinase [Vitreimonas sp.]|nr:protein kinase [Vitreimonas sp.]
MSNVSEILQYDAHPLLSAEQTAYEYYTFPLLGHGDYSRVYLGRNKETGQLVAIKAISPHAGPGASELLTTEAEALQMLQPGGSVVKLQDVIYYPHTSSSDRPQVQFLILELLEGSEELFNKAFLDQILIAAQEANTYIPLDTVFEIFSQVVDAWGQAWSHNIDIRELKTSSIGVINGQVKLADFNQAVPVGTPYQQLVGSPYYFSPEQAAGQSPTEHSYVFILATILYELLTNEKLFSPPLDAETPENPNAVLLRVYQAVGVAEKMTTLIDILKNRNFDQAETLAKVLLQALARHPAQRFEHPAELKAKVRAVFQPAATR